jgi:hypothetical protein
MGVAAHSGRELCNSLDEHVSEPSPVVFLNEGEMILIIYSQEFVCLHILVHLNHRWCDLAIDCKIYPFKCDFLVLSVCTEAL